MSLLNTLRADMYEEVVGQSTATNDTGAVRMIHIWYVEMKGGERAKGVLFFLDCLHLPAQWTALGLCENCPHVFCWFECADRHNRWSPCFQGVKSLPMALNWLAVGRRKFVTDSLNVSRLWRTPDGWCSSAAGCSLLSSETKEKFIPLIRKAQCWLFTLSAINHSNTCSLLLCLSFPSFLVFSFVHEHTCAPVMQKTLNIGLSWEL